MEVDKQVLYLGRWVSREHFRTFVYNSSGQRLANSYKEFTDLISSGTWFAEHKDIPSNEEMVEAANEEDNKVVDMKAKRGRKCQNQQPA